MPRRLAQQRITLSDLEWPFNESRAIYAVAELRVTFEVYHIVTVILDNIFFKFEVSTLIFS